MKPASKAAQFIKFNWIKEIHRMDYRRVGMKVYLVQHGEAKAEAEDPQRGLTLKGENEIRKLVKVNSRSICFIKPCLRLFA